MFCYLKCNSCLKLKAEDLNIQISKKLKELRIEAGYTSYENFALDYELARKYYWMAESGNAKFTIEYLSKILKIHNLTLSEFFLNLNL